MPKALPIINFTADGTEASPLLPGGEYAVHVYGTWSSGTMSIRAYDGTNAVEVPDGSLTADGGLIVGLGAGRLRFVLSGSTSPDLNVSFERI